MEITPLIDALASPAVYPYRVDAVEIHQTHISVVFLAGPYAYKIKKPVALGFLDFSTLEKRRRFCEEEVRLNRRLAPAVYLGVVPVTRAAHAIRLEAPGEVIEWAVKMQRLPEEAMLERHLLRQEAGTHLMSALAGRVAAFHVTAAQGRHIAQFGRFEVVARNARENFEQAAPQVGATLNQPVFARLGERTEDALARLRALIESRAERGVPRDTHGDLHLDHVYVFPDRQPCGDLLIIDCIEFNERFRFADPVADMAFLVMDLLFHGRRDLAESFANAYFKAASDTEGRSLLPFYTAYRAAVRGKVEGFKLLEKEIPEQEREAALTRARAHWLLALGELETPERRPCLVLLGGLPGTGKSTLAKVLAEGANFSVIRSDVVRKELAGLSILDLQAGELESGIYSPEWTRRVYEEMLHRAEHILFDGQRVIIDATFSSEDFRRHLLELAARLAVPGLLIVCTADPETVRARLAGRVGDASDADWRIYERAAEQWEPPGPLTEHVLRLIDTGSGPEAALQQARHILQEFRLLNP